MKILIEVYACYPDGIGKSFEGYIAKEESELENYLIENYLNWPEYTEDFKRFISGELNYFYVSYLGTWDDDPSGFYFVRYNTKEDALEAAKKKYDTTVASIEFAFKEAE